MATDHPHEITDIEGERQPGSGTGESTAVESGPPPSLSKDLIFEILKNERRRWVLSYLDEHGGETTLGTVAEHIAAKENDTDKELLSSAQRKRVYIALYQCHLPKMDDVGVIDYDQARGTLELREIAEELFPYLYLEPRAEGSEAHRLFGLLGSALDRLRSDDS